MKRRIFTLLILCAFLMPAFFGIIPALAADPGDVVINEIMQNPSAVGDTDGEWFELYNPTGSDIDIEGWTIADLGTDSHVIANGCPLVLPAVGYLVLGPNADTSVNGGAPVDYAYGSGWYLGNSDDEVILYDDSLVEIDRVEYDGGTTFPDPTGASMALKDPALDNNAGENWCIAVTAYGSGDLGTPGGENDCPAGAPPEVTIYDIQYTTDPSGDSPYVGQTVTTEGVVTGLGSSGYFIEEPAGGAWNGLWVYDNSNTPEQGDYVQLSGSVIEYNGLTELTNLITYTLESSHNLLPAPEVLATVDVGQEMYESVLVRVLNVTVSDPDLGFGEWAVDDGGGAVVVDNGDYTYTPVQDDPIGLLQGPLNYSYGAFKILPRSDFDIRQGMPAPPTTIYEIQYTTDPGGDSPLAGVEVSTGGLVTAVFYNGYFLQDPSAGSWSGVWVYDYDNTPAVGDYVHITGYVVEYNGLTEIESPTVFTSYSTANLLPPAQVLSSGDVSQEMWESVLVRVENILVTNPDLGFGEWSVDDGSGDMVVDDKSGYAYTPVLDEALDFVQGPLDYGFGAFKMQPRDDNDIGVGVPPPAEVSICEIQGSGQWSPYDGEVVTTVGVVTLVSANGSDMWIQHEDCDGDPATSDGIMVDDRNYLPVIPEVGDMITVTAAVDELQFYPGLPLTLLNNPDDYSVEISSSGNPLPVPVELTDLPNFSIADSIDFWEPLEGMRVSLDKGYVVSATSPYGEFAMLTPTDAVPGSGYSPVTKQLLIRNLGKDVVDYNPERIIVDDSSLDEPIQVMPGDLVREFTGVVDFTFGVYKLQPDEYVLRRHKYPQMPVSTRTGCEINAVITTFNVENLFDLINNPDKDDASSTPTPEELEVQLTKLAKAIIIELQLPEILVVQEVENTAILQELGDRVNAKAPTNYIAVSYETSDARGIEVGFLYDANQVSLLDAYQMSNSGVENWFGPTSPSPGREPLVGVFDINGSVVTIIGNHFKSKGGDDPIYSEYWPPIRVTEYQRKGQAWVVRKFVNRILDADPNALVMVTGDLNDFQFSEPGEGADNPVAILEGIYGGIRLRNLIYAETPQERFTYLYDGNSQVLDHMLVSPGLLDLFVAGDILHFNAGFPDYLGSNPYTTLRSSDHDPVEGRFFFP